MVIWSRHSLHGGQRRQDGGGEPSLLVSPIDELDFPPHLGNAPGAGDMIHETPNYDSRLQSSELRISIQSTFLQRATGAKVPPVQKLTESKSVIQNLGVEDRNSESHVSGDRLYF